MALPLILIVAIAYGMATEVTTPGKGMFSKANAKLTQMVKK